MKRNSLILVLALVVSLPGCKEHQDGAGAARVVHPESGLAVIPLTITHGGRQHDFRVELAKTAKEQATGLMFRTHLGLDEGMLFPMEPPRPASFWMRNTVIGLDLLFIAPDGRIANIAANAKPYDETNLTSAGPVEAVLELPAGRTAALGIVPGDTVSW
jgi:uncharacterized membrane protein (UPF0127 family)